MMIKTHNTKQFYFALLLLLLTVWSFISLLAAALTASNTAALKAGNDFYSYWYRGHFIRQGVDPYESFFENKDLDVPIRYLDSELVYEVSHPVGIGPVNAVPANTAPIVLMLTIFSFFSWNTAKILWIFCNLVFSLLIPYFVIVYFRIGRKELPEIALVYTLFWGLLSTRQVIGRGQTTLLCFTMILICLLLTGKNWLAGITLGVALSKYSIAAHFLSIY